MASKLVSMLQDQWKNEDLFSNKTLWLVSFTIGGAIVLNGVIKVVKNVVYIKRKAKELKDFDGPEPHWLYGNLGMLVDPRLGGDPIQVRLDLTKKYGPVYTFWYGGFMPGIQLNSAEYVQAIYNTAEPKDDVGYRYIKEWIGDGLLISSGAKWARNRRLLTPSFHFDILRPYVDVFRDSTKIMINKWKTMLRTDPHVEMFEHVSLMTLDSLMKCIFGMDGDFQQQGKKNPYIQAVYELSELIIKRFRSMVYRNDFIFNLTWTGFRLRRAINTAHRFTRDIVQKKKQEKLNGKGPQNDRKILDFLDMLLDCRDDEGNGLTDQEIYDEADTFMFEGHDTTASGLSWIFYHLASHPEIQEKCRQEINSILDDDNDLTWDKLGEMKYLSMCIKECLRVSPPVPYTGRKLTKPITLPDGRVVPKDIFLSIGIVACLHDPKHWPNPEQFDPERFSPENSKDRHPHAFVPFAAGPRNCIGQHFAMNEMKTCVAMVLRHFRLSPDPQRVPIRMTELIMRSVNGVWIKLEEI